MTEKGLDGVPANIQKIGERAALWIASADVKATALLAVAGAVLAIVLASPIKGTADAVLMTLFCAGSIISVWASALVILPRTDRIGILKKANCADPLTRSPSFFADLGQLGFPDFVTFASAVDDTTMKRDAIEQAYVMVAIARHKMRLMRIAVIALLCAMIFLGVAIFSASGAALLEKKDPAVSTGAVDCVRDTGVRAVQRSREDAMGVAKLPQEMGEREAETRSRSQRASDGGSLDTVDAGRNGPTIRGQ